MQNEFLNRRIDDETQQLVRSQHELMFCPFNGHLIATTCKTNKPAQMVLILERIASENGAVPGSFSATRQDKDSVTGCSVASTRHLHT